MERDKVRDGEGIKEKRERRWKTRQQFSPLTKNLENLLKNVRTKTEFAKTRAYGVNDKSGGSEG